MDNPRMKNKYGAGQMYQAFVRGFLGVPSLMANRRQRLVDSLFMERLMLAVTEVNGCDLCSYAHTRMALKEGFSADEIQAFLSGSTVYVNEEEATAILYAQHVADTMGNPDLETQARLVEVYGKEKAKIIQAGIATIMLGNTAGIPMSALLRRVRGRPYENSSLAYELGMTLLQPVFFLAAAGQAAVHSILKIKHEA